jgi:hypothetical protein
MTTETTNLSVVPENTDPTNKIVICVENNGEDVYWNYEDFGLSFNSSEDQILRTLQGAIEETFNVSIRDSYSNQWLYKTRKAVNSQNIYLIPNSTAGVR